MGGPEPLFGGFLRKHTVSRFRKICHQCTPTPTCPGLSWPPKIFPPQAWVVPILIQFRISFSPPPWPRDPEYIINPVEWRLPVPCPACLRKRAGSCLRAVWRRFFPKDLGEQGSSYKQVCLAEARPEGFPRTGEDGRSSTWTTKRRVPTFLPD